MKTVLMFVGVLAFLALFEAGVWTLLSVAREKEEKREREVREGYPWDWTKESERKAQAALELICDKCHEPYRCSQDELDEACAMCPVPDAVYRLATGTFPSSARSGHIPPVGEEQRAAEGVGPYKSESEEVRG